MNHLHQEVLRRLEIRGWTVYDLASVMSSKAAPVKRKLENVVDRDWFFLDRLNKALGGGLEAYQLVDQNPARVLYRAVDLLIESQWKGKSQ
jgi:hypothetical protein